MGPTVLLFQFLFMVAVVIGTAVVINRHYPPYD